MKIGISLCAEVPKEVIVYRSALLDYIYNGEIFVVYKTLVLDVEDRIRHLGDLIERLNSGNCSLTIINDVNPILNLEDTSISLFLSRKSGFMVAIGDTETPIIRFRSVRTIEYFNEFFDHLQSLGEDYCVNGQQATDFIARGIQILEGKYNK